ncbi:OmpA family protein [Pseudoduganella namucuonensis]|uniref:OmpA family protein n=1 Tax=Pseudoduganella namucuonensis TaxID=1035707 RepID=A0A1I7M468_9BURK|nr:OmpA family protein [Pseudoduganella namucuonensis]SFV16728.1 OmpA family protein [Pseudoduganella namucuonensis]
MKRRALQTAPLLAAAVFPLPMLLGGCASVQTHDGAQRRPAVRPSTGFEIVQLGYGDASYFGTCLHPACPVVTPKTISAPQPPARPGETEVSVPQQQDRFTMPDIVAVHFLSGSARLQPAAAAVLVHASNQARLAARITVVGRTDDVGGHAFNQRLAWRRARAVADFLREQLGVAPGRITLEGRGVCCYVADNAASAGRQANRRAEVTFHPAREDKP